MRIAVWHNLPSGGGKRALYYHVRGLVERGHDVECWSLDTADHSYLPLTEFAPEHVIPSKKTVLRDPSVSRWSNSFNEEVERMRAYDEGCKRSAQEIEARNFDVVFVNSALPYHMPYIMRHLRMPNVLYLQEPNRFLYEAQQGLPWAASAPEDLNQARLSRRDFVAEYPLLQFLRLQAKQEWLNAQACDNILVNSYFSRESVARAYGVDAKVCYLGIDTTLFRNLGMERERFIVGLGSCDTIKRITLAVEAVSLLDPSPPFVWISNSRNEAYAMKVGELAKSLRVDLRIKNRISDAELITTLNTANLLLYTSRLEPFGFAPLEANACGLPVVAVTEGGVRETIQDGVNGFLVDAEPEKIARAADRLLQNPTLAREIGENAALHVRRTWSLESSVERLEAFLRQAVSARTQPARLTNKPRRSVSSSPNGNSLTRPVQPLLLENAGMVNPGTNEAALDVDLPRPLGANQARAICTIIAKNYIAFARTLAQSFLSFHPDNKCFVLIVDDFEGYINPADECFEVIKLADLGIPNLRSFCFQYDIKELCTAVKADLLEYLISEKSIDQLLYLDPDILVTGSFDGLFERLRTYDIVLTPHLDTDYPDDDFLPDDGWILRAGLFNLGFIGVNSSENARLFLNWWKSKLYKNCVVDVMNGYFVDQKFIDFVPLYFRNVFIEKNVGYNVAYWNVHSRLLSKNNGHWLCNSEALYFFHFSGYPAPERGAISVYVSNCSSRYEFSNRPDLQQIFSHYKNLLIRNGHKRARSWPYTFAYFKTGEPIPNELRAYYRNNSECRNGGDPFESLELKSRAGINPKSEEPPHLSPGTRAAEAETQTEPVELSAAELTAREQLNAILNTRAWRWASRYGRFKHRFLLPAYRFFWRLFSGTNLHPRRGKN